MPSAEQKVRKRRAAVIRRRRARRKWHNFVAARSGNEEQAVRECRRCSPDAVGALSRGYGGVPANITQVILWGIAVGGTCRRGEQFFYFICPRRAPIGDGVALPESALRFLQS